MCFLFSRQWLSSQQRWNLSNFVRKTHPPTGTCTLRQRTSKRTTRIQKEWHMLCFRGVTSKQKASSTVHSWKVKNSKHQRIDSKNPQKSTKPKGQHKFQKQNTRKTTQSFCQKKTASRKKKTERSAFRNIFYFPYGLLSPQTKQVVLSEKNFYFFNKRT